MIGTSGAPTPRDDQKKLASDVLKRVDMLIKQGDLSQALAEVKRAKEIDPKNVYAVAFEERIAQLIRDGWKDSGTPVVRDEPVAPKPSAAPATPPPPKPTPPTLPKPTPPTPAPPQPRPAPPPEPPKPRPTPPPAPPAPSAPEKSLYERLKEQLDSYNSYKKALVEVWADGAATEKEREWLAALRNTLHISKEDHERLEHEVQLDAYLQTLKVAWTHGRIKAENATMLADMRKTFNISQEDHDKIETRFLAELQAQEKKQARIVVVDDEKKLLDVICDTLQEAGYATLPFTTSDEAYAYLKGGAAPDLILCDVNLETSTMGGFSFYEKIQWLDHLTEVPFIFLTGLTDEVLIRTGKELGVDDYLTKPISDQTLVATIRGKLKRFKRLKNRS